MTSSKRIDAVIVTLKDILQSVQGEDKIEAQNYKCYMEWCDKELKANNQSLADSQSELDAQKTGNEASTAKVASLTQELSKNKDEQAELEATLAQATELRNEEKAQYTQDASYNTQSQSEVNRAIEIVGKVHEQGGFLQNGAVHKLQINQPGESKYVLGIMKGIDKRLVDTRAKMDAAEAEKQTQYEEMLETKNAQIKSLEDDYAEKQAQNNEAKVAVAESKNNAIDEADSLVELKRFAADLTEKCNKKTAQWQIRSVARQEEKAAIRQAISFLVMSATEEKSAPAAAPAVFFQESLKMSVAVHPQSITLAPRRAATQALFSRPRQLPAAPVFLQKSMEETPSSTAAVATILAQTADAQFAALVASVDSKSRKEGFNGALKIVEELGVTLQDTQIQEDKKKMFCQKELAEKSDEKAEATIKSDALNASIMKKETAIALYVDEVAKLEHQDKLANQTMWEAKQLRDKEATAFQTGTKERSLAAKVVGQAKKIMKKFYDSLSFRQQRTEPRSNVLKLKASKRKAALKKGQKQEPKTWEEGSTTEKSVSGQQVTMLMDKIVEDIKTEQKSADMDEKDQQVEYNKFVRESKKAIDARHEEITNRVSRKSKLLVQVNDHKEELASLGQDLEHIVSELQSLHNECDQLLANYDKRKEARGFEINQLKDVLDILKGASIATRTGASLAQQSAVTLTPDAVPAYVQSAPAIPTQAPQPSSTQSPVPQISTAAPQVSDAELSALQELSLSIDSLKSKAIKAVSQ
jgi:hypothetical protein